MVGVRKRAQVNYAEPKDDAVAEEEEEEVIHSDEEAQAAESSEEEEERPAQMTPKQTPSRQRKRRQAELLPDMAGDTTLINAVRSPSAAITMAAKDWVDRCRANKDAATAELLTFLLQACGVTDRALTEEEVAGTSVDELRAEADEIAKEEGLEDTLGGRTGKHKASYRELWDKLVRESASGGLLRADGETFLEIVSNFSIALSMSAVREFRRVGTATAAQIATSLLHVAATLEDGRSTAEAQLEAEEGRKGKAAADRAAAFKRQRDEAIAAISSIKTHVDSIFQSVFSIRFRDIDTEIRAIVVDAIGRWMMLFPSVYLTANYLKYVAWALSDKEASVRMVAANALLTLYSSAQNPTQLRDFTDRFRGRFAELVYDKEDAVAVAGVRLVTLLVRLEHLPVTAGAKLYRLMSDVSPAIRAAAAELAAGMLKHLGAKALAEAAGGAGAKPGAKGKKGRSKPAANATASGQSDEEVELAGVLYVLRVLASQQLTAEKNEEDEEDRAPRKKGDGDDEAIDDEAGPLAEGAVERVISALVDRSPALRNWQLMVNWLKEDTAATLFGDAAAQDLAVCLATALHTATAEPAAGAGRRPGARDKAAAARNAARQDATLVLQKELQVLIRKFQSEPAMVAAVVRLVPQLKLEVFSLRRQEKSLGSLLAAVKDVMFKHADVNVAAACSSALEKCATTGPDTTRDAARAVLGECIAASAAELDKAATGLEEAGARELKSAWEAYISSNGEEESAVLFAARAAALRAAALAEAYPTGVQASDKARGALTRMLEVAAGVAVLPAPIIYHAGRAALLVLITDLSHITKEEPDVAALGDLAAGVSAFAEALEGIVAAAGAADEDHVTEAVAALHADFMLVFSAENLPPALQPTAYRPSDAVVESFWEGIHAAMLQRPATPDGVDPGRVIAMPPAEVATRLCVCHSVPQYRQLAAGLLSFWEYDEEALPSNVAKDMVRLLKASDAQHLPGIYLGAMQASYHRCKVSAQEYDPEEFDDELRAYEFAMAPFLRLSLRIAQSQAAFNAPVATLAYVAEEGAKWALEQAPERLDFLDGTVYFATRLKGEAASAVLAAVEAAGTAAGAPALDAKGNDDEEVEAWANYHAYCEHLSQQVAKGAGSGLRGKSKARSKAGQQRRISFAPGVEGSDEEDANADGGAVGVEEAPAVSTAARMKAQRVQRAARATRRRRGGDEEMAEEEGEDDEVDVMPTEEQLPGMRPAAAAVQQPGSDEDSDGEEEHQVRRRRRR